MKKIILFILTVACLAGVFFLEKDYIIENAKTFKYAFEEIEQWKTLM